MHQSVSTAHQDAQTDGSASDGAWDLRVNTDPANRLRSEDAHLARVGAWVGQHLPPSEEDP
jgi:hypothetical protein